MLPHDTRVPADATPDVTPEGGIYVIRLSDSHYYGGRTGDFRKRWADHHRDLPDSRQVCRTPSVSHRNTGRPTQPS